MYTGDRDGEEEAMHPFLWRFAIRCPEKGRIAIFDTSWNRRIFADGLTGIWEKERQKKAFRISGLLKNS